MITEDTKIAIVGMGLLGGSYARGFANAGMHVVGIDIDEDALEYALQQGWIAEGGNDPSLISQCDLVISALYPKTFVAWVKENQKYFRSGALLSDVTGVKQTVIREITEILRPDVEYIACHPMAGREYRGIRYSDEKRFESANFIIVPTEKNTPEAIGSARKIAQILKFAHVAVLSPEEHDRMIAFLSQLTHVIAVSLMNASDQPNLAEYTGDSFRDLTRIAAINEDLWPELFVMNKEALLIIIDRFQQEISEMRRMIDEEDIEGLKKKLITSTERRKAFTY